MQICSFQTTKLSGPTGLKFHLEYWPLLVTQCFNMICFHIYQGQRIAFLTSTLPPVPIPVCHSFPLAPRSTATYLKSHLHASVLCSIESSCSFVGIISSSFLVSYKSYYLSDPWGECELKDTDLYCECPLTVLCSIASPSFILNCEDKIQCKENSQC